MLKRNENNAHFRNLLITEIEKVETVVAQKFEEF